MGKRFVGLTQYDDEHARIYINPERVRIFGVRKEGGTWIDVGCDVSDLWVREDLETVRGLLEGDKDCWMADKPER